nr:uncharacterized protein LOC126519255 [Dermacentor andersoni]
MQGPLRPAVLTHLYHQVMLPALTHASAVWWAARPDCRLSARVTTMQRTVLLSLSGAYRTTRTASLQVLMRVPLLSLALDRTAAEFRLFALREAVEFGDLAFSPRDILYPADPWKTHPSEMRAFSFAQLSVAAARSRSRHRHRLRGRKGTGEVSIYTDCLSLLQAVATPGSTDRRIVRIKTALGEVARSSEVRLYHVPGHCGVFGNELADFLASRAARYGFDRKAPLPFKSVRVAFRAVQRARWARSWREDHSDAALFRWVPRLEDAPSLFPPPRALVTMLTGHGRFPYYFQRFGLARDSLCPCGAECESFEHYLGDCSLPRPLAASLEPPDALAVAWWARARPPGMGPRPAGGPRVGPLGADGPRRHRGSRRGPCCD